MNEKTLGAVIIVENISQARRRVAGLMLYSRLFKQLSDLKPERIYVVSKDAQEAGVMHGEAKSDLPPLPIEPIFIESPEPAKAEIEGAPAGRCAVASSNIGYRNDVLAYALNVSITENLPVAVTVSDGEKDGETVAAKIAIVAEGEAFKPGAQLNSSGAKILRPSEKGWFAFPVKESWDANAADELYLLTVRKPLDVDGIICWLFSRRISTYCTKWILRVTPWVRPSQVTVIAFLLGLVAGIFAAIGSYWAMLVGAFLYQCSTTCDNIDGEIARLTWRGSYLGQWLDTLSDDTTNLFFMTGMAVGLSRMKLGLGFPFENPNYWMLGLAGVFMISVYNYFIYIYLLKYTDSGDVFLYRWFFDVKNDAKTEPDAKPSHGFMYYVKFMGRRDFFIFAFLCLAAANYLFIGLWAMVIASAITFILVLIQEFKYNKHVRK